MGNYDENPEAMSKNVEPFSKEGLVTIVGGCCGITLNPTLFELSDQHQVTLRKRITPRRRPCGILNRLDKRRVLS